MPTHSVKGGGFQWGSHGKVYKGKGAKAKADRQGRAIRASGWTESGSKPKPKKSKKK